MITGKEIIVVNRKISLQTYYQSYEATVTKLEENLFWINFPQEDKQPLVLTMKQSIEVGVSIQLGYYTSQTTVVAIDNDIHKFYGLLIPDHFTKSRERKYRRSHFSNNITFNTDNLTALTTMIDFSAGGIQVYATSELEEIIQSGNKIYINLQIDGNNFQLEVILVWQKKYNNIPFAGFEFINIDNLLQDKLENFASKFTS